MPGPPLATGCNGPDFRHFAHASTVTASPPHELEDHKHYKSAWLFTSPPGIDSAGHFIDQLDRKNVVNARMVSGQFYNDQKKSLNFH